MGYFPPSFALLLKKASHHPLVKAQIDPCWPADLYMHIFLFHYDLFPGSIMPLVQIGALISASVAFVLWQKRNSHLYTRRIYPLRGYRVSAALYPPRAQSSCMYSYQLRKMTRTVSLLMRVSWMKWITKLSLSKTKQRRLHNPMLQQC